MKQIQSQQLLPTDQSEGIWRRPNHLSSWKEDLSQATRALPLRAIPHRIKPSMSPMSDVYFRPRYNKTSMTRAVNSLWVSLPRCPTMRSNLRIGRRRADPSGQHSRPRKSRLCRVTSTSRSPTPSLWAHLTSHHPIHHSQRHSRESPVQPASLNLGRLLSSNGRCVACISYLGD